jgi:hypothetical protein
MAVTINVTSTERITPQELLEWAIDNVDPTDDESMKSASERLCALSNNRDFIIEKIRQQMFLLASGQGDDISSPQGTVHAAGLGPKGSFIVRSGVWTPSLTADLRAKKVQDKVFSFVTPHDHNFSLLTIGYHGPGYSTEVYEYDRKSVVGENGELVSLKYLETTTLSKGRILYFRPCCDIHAQFHPVEISISLNLIGQSPDITSIPQYEFDVKNSKIKGLLPGTSVMDLLVPFTIIECLGGDQNIVDIISRLASRHNSQYVRGAAYKTLAKICPNDFEKLVTPGMDDNNQFVKNVVKALSADLSG